jgi:3-methyl-2-oxobutanoate hydroxymethyltransferase
MSSYSNPNDKDVRKKISTSTLATMRQKGEKIAMLTCYDASFAALMDRNQVDVLLIGDSLGMVCQGHDSTLAVTLEDISYHVKSVARAVRSSLVLADMPFGSYGTPEQAFENAVTLMRNGAEMVKCEGGSWLVPTVQFLVERGIPVCAHLGLTPQSVFQLGGFKVQGKTTESAQQLIHDALALQEAGASLLVLEAIPTDLAEKTTAQLSIPTIGIGAGVNCSGQVLVMHDMLGVFPGHKAKFVRNFMESAHSIEEAIQQYVLAVRDLSFPSAEHSF